VDPAATAEIERLYAIYARTLDGGDPEGWAGCFTPDGSFEPSSGGRVVGTDALRAFATDRQAAWRAEATTVKHWSNHHIFEEVDGGARLLASCYGMVVATRRGKRPEILVSSTFHDELVLHEGRWLFASRVSLSDGG
jgi:uncharacterized protein (TIGR02246 family)